MARIHRLIVSPTLINTSSTFSSSKAQLLELFETPLSGAVTTRTATLSGFPENASHAVSFSRRCTSSINSYGYSPHPLSFYLESVESILRDHPKSIKPFFISVTSLDPETLEVMLQALQNLRHRLDDHRGQHSRVGIEFNCSCPNIIGHPPPAYNMPSLRPFLQVMADCFDQDKTLTIGLKLPPYVYATQFSNVVAAVSSFSVDGINPFAFFTCTNTLGNSLLFVDEVISREGVPDTQSEYAVPTGLGGLAGESIHPLSLGNVFSFTRLLRQSNDPALKAISIIGAGGVTDSAAVERMRKAGANVVGFATLLGIEGVKAFEVLTRPHTGSR